MGEREFAVHNDRVRIMDLEIALLAPDALLG